jgi:hypothetical protein
MPPAKKVDFDTEDVHIHLPELTKKVSARKLPFGDLKKMPGEPGGFQPKRGVINFELYDEDEPQTPLTKLTAEFMLRVRYTSADLENSQQAGQPLALAYWFGGKWVRFSAEKHRFTLQPDPAPGTGGYGVVYITDWGDPPISWGQ